MTENNQNYYAFVHGTGGVGDFDLSVVEENDNVFVGTDPPTEASLTYGKDLHRWVPINSDSLNLSIGQGWFDASGCLLRLSLLAAL